ncbi:MAG TPA: zinc ABC transporter substrate-binding protein, partial [Chloroflexota bacterium]|nr:zinc ABC transporter substrate-binding protein [Chloroflexota bacterium]
MLPCLILVTLACASATAVPASTSASKSAALAQPIRVVAAENFYGDVASQIGGDRVTVVAILSDPSTDPHEYETNADDAKAVANAQVLVKNSLGYDAFVDHLTSASPRPDRITVDVSQLTGRAEGDNPHQWYDPTTMPRVAQRLAAVFTQVDPTDRAYFAERLQTFTAREKSVDDAVAALQAKYK